MEGRRLNILFVLSLMFVEYGQTGPGWHMPGMEIGFSDNLTGIPPDPTVTDLRQAWTDTAIIS